MAKVGFGKFKLKMPEPVEMVFNDINIEVKTYLPINDKLDLIANAINNAADENKFFNIGKLELFYTLEVIKYYTNISFTEKQLEDPCKLYDLIKTSNLFVRLLEIIGPEELEHTYSMMITTVEAIYKYNNSVLGILDTISQDYSNLKFDAEEIQKHLADPDNMALLKGIMAKLG